MLFYTTFARRTFTVSVNELFENYTDRRTHVYSGHMGRLKYPPWVLLELYWEYSYNYVFVYILSNGVECNYQQIRLSYF